MSPTDIDRLPTAASRRTTLIGATSGVLTLVVVAFGMGRASVGENTTPFEGTVVNVSANQDAIGVKPIEGEQINGVLAHSGTTLAIGDTVSGEVVSSGSGGSIVYVTSN